MNKLFNPAFWGRALSQPVVLLGLAVDLLPIYGVVAWGWGAMPLVMLYWMENVVIGVMTLPRIFVSGASYGGIGLLAGLGLCVFFVFHYGLFCLVHGTFLIAFAEMGEAMRGNAQVLQSDPFMDMFGMFRFGLDSGRHVDWMISAIAAFQVVVFFWEFVIKAEWKTTNPMAEMFAPYERIIILHIGIFAGAGALILLGEPMIGVLALILLRAIWGVITNAGRTGVGFGAESDWNKAVSKMSKREVFEKMLRGETIDP